MFFAVQRAEGSVCSHTPCFVVLVSSELSLPDCCQPPLLGGCREPCLAPGGRFAAATFTGGSEQQVSDGSFSE